MRAMSRPSASLQRRSHSSCNFRNSGNSCVGLAIVTGGATDLGARIRNFGGGVAIQISSRPRKPSENGPVPRTLSYFPRSMALAIIGCTTLAETFRWAKHSAIDHFAGSGRCVSWPASTPLINASARRRISSSSAVKGFISILEIYSHSIVPGGFEVTSYTTRLIPRTSFTMRLEIVFNTSYGKGTQSAVMPSSEWTARTAQVYA